MEIMDGYNEYDNIYNNAYWAKHELDKPRKYFDMDDAKDRYTEFLAERQKNRTLGDIAFAEVIRKNPIKNKHHYTDNFINLANEMRDRGTLFEAEDFNQKYYPKSCKIRNTLVESNRFRLDKVLPKLTGLKKIMMRMKTIV